jgi:hypothetical protein
MAMLYMLYMLQRTIYKKSRFEEIAGKIHV